MLVDWPRLVVAIIGNVMTDTASDRVHRHNVYRGLQDVAHEALLLFQAFVPRGTPSNETSLLLSLREVAFVVSADAADTLDGALHQIRRREQPALAEVVADA